QPQQEPLYYDWLEHDFIRDPKPLLDALPAHLRLVLADLFERYRLVRKVGAKHTPFYKRSPTEAAIKAALDEHRRYGTSGPITKAEMDVAIRILHPGRTRKFDAKHAAQQLRRQARARLADDYGLMPKQLQSRLKDRRSSHNRRR